MVALAVKALFALHHVFTAAGAFANSRPPGIGERGRGHSHIPVGPDQPGEHGGDPGHEVLRGQLAPLHSPQPVLHSAVSLADLSWSGMAQDMASPFSVGRSCFFFRSTKPERTSFSITPARVAGVPSPLRSTSSNFAKSSALACSMAESRVSSDKLCQGCFRKNRIITKGRMVLKLLSRGNGDFGLVLLFQISVVHERPPRT